MSMRREQGVVLFIALIVLVAMSLAGIALMRSVDTGILIAGNLGFRQNATHVGDLGIEKARSWLITNSASLNNDQPAVSDGTGYWATMQSGLDLLGNDPAKVDYDWSTGVGVTTPAPPAGYAVRYVINRLCASSGAPSDTGCVKSADTASSASGTKGAAVYGSYAISASTSALYRVTVKVTGPRNSVSYVQAVVY